MGHFLVGVLVDFDGGLGHTEHLLEELLGKIVAVVDQAVPAENVDSIANNKVLGSIKLLLL